MAQLLKFSIDDRNVRKTFAKLPTEVKTQVGDGMFKYAKLCQRNLRLSLTKGGHNVTGYLWDNINARKVSNLQSIVTMPEYGINLDSMSPHYVSAKNAYMRNWIARRPFGTKTVTGKSYLYTDKNGKMSGAIYVTKHPFIMNALITSQQSFDKIMKRKMQNALKNSKN